MSKELDRINELIEATKRIVNKRRYYIQYPDINPKLDILDNIELSQYEFILSGLLKEKEELENEH